MIAHIFRADATNVGDWHCAPKLYFDLGDQSALDILDNPALPFGSNVIVGGGGLIARTFAPMIEALVQQRPKLRSLVAWGVGESLNVDRLGGLVAPWSAPLPGYLEQFDLVGMRDYGTQYPWVPCASCMHDLFDRPYEIEHPVVIYEHKRIPIAISGPPRRNNAGSDLAAVLAFLGSGDLVITNSYHGAYWATLLGRRVVAIPNMSKLYRLKHAPVIARPDQWLRYAPSAKIYPEALDECRAANRAFHARVREFVD